MVRAKNYETAPTFVKVMQKKTLASFFRTRCIICRLWFNHNTQRKSKSPKFTRLE